MNTHSVELDGYYARSRGSSTIYLGTAGSHGNEQIQVTQGKGWEGLTVQVVFHPSKVAVQLPANGLLDVPWEATENPLTAMQGRIVFQGFDQDRLVNSTDLAYTVASHSPVLGRDEEPYTPGIVEGVLNQMAADKDAILQAAQQANQAKEAAAASATEAAGSAANARQSAGAANTSAGQAAASAAAAGETLTQVQTAGQQQSNAVAEVGNAQVRAVQEAGAQQVQAVNTAGDNKLNQINTAIAHPPQPNTATGFWQVWNAETGQYEDTTAIYQGGYYMPSLSADGTLTWTGSQAGMPALPSANIQGPQGLGVPTPSASNIGQVPTVNNTGDGYRLAGPYAPLDAVFQTLLDGTNTTEIFYAWWNLSDGQGTKYQRLERFAKMLAVAAKDKTYTVRFYDPSVSSDYTGTPLDDLADGREAAPLLTDADEPVADWAAEDPMTWYIRANALSLEDGTMNVLAVEGEIEFDLTGETAPVYCFALATTMKEWGDGTYIYNSWRTMTGGGYEPMAGDVAPDGGRRWLTWHPAFHGGLNSAGGMTSGVGLPPMQFTGASSAISLARKITAYDALWTDCDQLYVLAQWRLRHWTLSNSGKLDGCTSYNYQYALSVAETDVKRVIVTKAQGANFIVGSAVCVGERGENTNNDRGRSYMRDVVAWARITSIDDVVVEDVTYSALTLDIEEPITTTTTMYVSTMPWVSGATEGVPGHSDGCPGNLTNGKYPYRVAGIEMQIGAYIEQLEPLWQASLVDDHWHYDVYSCRDGAKQASTITSDYEKTGEFDLPDSKTYTWNYIRALGELGAEAMDYKEFGGSSSTYLRAAFYSAGDAGLCAPWRGGFLNDGGNCGLPCARGHCSPGTATWLGVPRLAGSGKKRG